LHCLRVQGLKLGRPVQGHDAQAFVWDAEPTEAWLRRCPLQSGGFQGESGLPVTESLADLAGPPHALCLQAPPRAGLAYRVNQALLRRSAARATRLTVAYQRESAA
jgi:hypothetical protein